MPPRTATQNWAFRGFHRHNLHPRLLLLEVCPSASNGAARTNPADEDVYLPLSVAPDLWTSCEHVCLRVAWVFKLLQDERVGGGACKLLRLGYSALWRFIIEKENLKGLQTAQYTPHTPQTCTHDAKRIPTAND